MPPKKKKGKKGRRGKSKADATVEEIVQETQNKDVVIEDESKKAEEEAKARLHEMKRRWKKKMNRYVKFVALGRSSKNHPKRKRRASYLMASGQTPRERRKSITARVEEIESAFPLAFKVLTPQHQMYSSEIVIDVTNLESLSTIREKLIQEVGPPLISPTEENEAPILESPPASPTPSLPETTPQSSSDLEISTTESSTEAIVTSLPNKKPSPEAKSFGLSFFYTPPGSMQRRRLETESEWRWALKDFHKNRDALSLESVQGYTKTVLNRLRSTHQLDTPESVGQTVSSISQIWQFAHFIDAHHYISSEEIKILCHQIAQSRKAISRSTAAGALWAVAYNHHLRLLTHQSDTLVNTLTDPRFLISMNNFADGDKESIRLHTHIFGLMATILSEGTLSKDDLLGDGGTALLGSYLRVAPGGATTPQGTRMAAQSLLDSCIRSANAQYRMGKASNSEVVSKAENDLADALEAASKEAALGQESSTEFLMNVKTNERIVAKVNIVSIIGKALGSIKDPETFRNILDIVVIFSRSPSEELREALALTTTTAGYSIAATLLGIFSDIQQGLNQYQNISNRTSNELMLRVLAALWGLLESTARSKKAYKRASKTQQLLPGVASLYDVASDMLNFARSLALTNDSERKKLIVIQQAYCAVSCVMCLVGPVIDSFVFQDPNNAGVDPDSVALKLFSSLSELYDEAKDKDNSDTRFDSSLSATTLDPTSHGNGWASVRRRIACTMAILTSNSVTLCQDLSVTGYFERLVSQVQEEQVREKHSGKTSTANGTADKGVSMIVNSTSSGNSSLPENGKPSACEWLLRALANIAGTESERPLVTSVIETCCQLLLDPTSNKKGVVRQVGPGLDSVILMLWRLGRRFKDHRMAMMLDGSVVNLLHDAAKLAMKLRKLDTLESILSLLHLLVADIMDEKEEPARKGEESKGVCYIQTLHVNTFERWVKFLLQLVQECGGKNAFKNSSRHLVRLRTTSKVGRGKKSTSNTPSVAARPPLGEGSKRNRPGFGGRRTHDPKKDSSDDSYMSGENHVLPPEPYIGSSAAGSSEVLCNVWTLAVTNLWTLSVAKSLGFQMLDGGLPAMLTRLCLEQGTRLSPLFRIRAAGCAMFMAMKREYCDFFQYVCFKSAKGSPSIKPCEPGTAARAATSAFMTKAKPLGAGRPRYAEILAVTLLHMNDYDLRCYGATCIARLAVSQVQKKKNIVKLGGVDLLIEQLNRSSNREQFTEFAMQAILNLSTHRPNQEYICSCAKGICLERMLNMVRDSNQPTAAAYAAALLSNISQHPANRTKLYRAELKSTVDVTYGAKQEKPITMFNSGIQGMMANKLQKSSALNSGATSMGNGTSNLKNTNKGEKARLRFNTWFDSEIAKDMTELQIQSLKKLEGENGRVDTSFNKNIRAHRPLSPRLVSETVRQLKLSSIPVPYKVFSDAAQRNLQAKMCQPLATLWQTNKNVPTVKQLAMTASMQAGALTLTPGVNEGPALDPAWMDASSRAVLRWAPMIHEIIETDKNEVDMKRQGVRLKSGRKAEIYKHAPPEMTVVLEPRQSPRNQVKFTESGKMSSNRARLAVWTHIQGSKASNGLFPQYTLPNGEKAFFYENQGMNEAIFPPEMPPVPPRNEENFGSPVPLKDVQAEAPDWEDDPPLIRCLPAPIPPICPNPNPGELNGKISKNRHADYQTLNEVVEEATDKEQLLSFSIAHRLNIFEKEIVVEHVKKDDWKLEDSIFAPRPYESDSNSFWNEEWVGGAAFNVDWARAIRKQSFRNLVCSTHGAGRCAFETGDEIEVQSEDMTYWYPATVIAVARGPSLKVLYGDRSEDHNVSLSRVRFPGGKAGGFGGRCRRWQSPRTEVANILLPAEALPDIIGLNGSEIRRMRFICGCKISVKQNGNSYTLVAVGVPENIEILHELIAEIEQLALVRQALRHNYSVSLATFDLFRSFGTGDSFAIQANEYEMFLLQCGISENYSKSCNRSILSNIFVIVNTEEIALTNDERKVHEFNSDTGIVRFEFLELIVRVAHAKYSREASGLDECIEMLFSRNIEPFLGTLGEMDHNIFRDAVLYTKSTDQILKKNLHFLISIFTGYAGTIQVGPRGGKKRDVLMSQPEWLSLLRSFNLLTSQFSITEAKFCFHSSQLLVIDDVNQPNRSKMLTFCSFLEAFCRMCDIMFIPTKEELSRSGHADFHDYQLQFMQAGILDAGHTPRGSFSIKNDQSAHKHYLHRRHDDKRPLSQRLQTFFEMLLKRLKRCTIKKGTLKKRRRIAAWYADKNYEVTRNSSHDIITANHIIETTAKSLVASKPAPKLVFVQQQQPTRPKGKKSKAGRQQKKNESLGEC
jgi:hypothetical protein